MKKKDARERRSPGAVLFPVMIILALLCAINAMHDCAGLSSAKGYLYYNGQVYTCRVDVDRYAKSDFSGDLEEVGVASYVKTDDTDDLTEDFQTTVRSCDGQKVYRLSSRPDDLVVYRIDAENCPYLLFVAP
jgi:hypothetical protein